MFIDHRSSALLVAATFPINMAAVTTVASYADVEAALAGDDKARGSRRERKKEREREREREGA